jgi:hypothetical protein
MENRAEIVFRGAHCTLGIRRPSDGVVVVSLAGNDVGEFGDGPFKELEPDVRAAAAGSLELFIDARSGVAASMDVSGEWAIWLGTHKRSFRHVSMLTGSRFIQLSAGFVRKFADMGELMRLYTDPAAFEGALASAIANAQTR